MPDPSLPGWRSFLFAAGVLIVAGVAAAAVLIWSGLYNVAASKEHFAITRWILETALHQSVETHSGGRTVPNLDDPDLMRLGAGHFAIGCAPCHGAPGEPQSPIVLSMLPSPPRLSDAVGKWPPEELFWIVRNGFKYTGMPAWPVPEREDEVWAVVAFLLTLPELDAREYQETADGGDSALPIGETEPSSAAAICTRCHDGRNAPLPSRFAPRLAGQQEAYLRRALEEYAERRRPSGMMQAVAGDLSAPEIRRLAAYYSSLPARPGTPTSVPDRGSVERGAKIAREGIPERGIPPCLACHSGRASETFPLLAGQSATYLVQQLELWHSGLRDETAHGAIMSAVARRLTREDILDAAAYFEAASPTGLAPVAAARTVSVPQ